MADNLPPSSADVTESGILNLPEPSGSHRPVMGLLYSQPHVSAPSIGVNCIHYLPKIIEFSLKMAPIEAEICSWE
jgi:hypothetical protein